MIKMKCCLCGVDIDDWGNNPYPLCDEEDFDSRCCNTCDKTFVIPARFKMVKGMTQKQVREEYLKERK